MSHATSLPRILAVLALALCAEGLLGDTRYVKTTPSATTAVETVKWGTGVSYSYDPSGNVTDIGDDEFIYDRVGRLVEAKVNGVTRTYTYDSFGNRTECVHAPGKPEQSDCQWGLQIDPESNRVSGTMATNTGPSPSGVSYDEMGNVETFGGHTFTYDDVNMPTRDSSGSGLREFVYTADDERLATYTVGSTWNWTVRDVSGRVLREFSSNDTGAGGPGTGSWKWARDYVWRDGLLLASRHPVADAVVTYHYHLDHLGTPRRITDDSDQIAGFHDYHAFGPETGDGLDEPSPTSLKYTGHERDGMGFETLGTLDYMHARYYSPALGRFLSVDPILGQPSRPQTWNRYSYANNNPLNLIDPKGMYETDCGGDIDCQMNAAYFEGARRQALASRDAAARSAAAAYGEPDEANGVLVTFGATSHGRPAETSADTSWSMQMVLGPPGRDGTRHIGAGAATPLWGVTVTFDGADAITPANVAHEGVHVSHALPFFRSWDGTAFNDGLRVSQYFTESAAYNVTAAFTPRNGTMTIGGQHVFRHGMNTEQRQAVVDAILRDPALKYRISPTNQGGSWPP